MRIAIVSSSGLYAKELGKFLPEGVTEIVSRGTEGVETQAREYAQAKGIPFTGCLADYEKRGREALLERAGLVLAFWDGLSQETQLVLEACTERGSAVRKVLRLAGGEILEQEAKHAQVVSILAQAAQKKGKSLSKMSAGELRPGELIRLMKAVVKARRKTKGKRES